MRRLETQDQAIVSFDNVGVRYGGGPVVLADISFSLDRGSFHPQPKVRSAVVILDPDRKPFASEELIDLISHAFRMRRKKLVNNLIGWRELSREKVLAAMERAGIEANARAETVDLEAFARLGQVMSG